MECGMKCMYKRETASFHNEGKDRGKDVRREIRKGTIIIWSENVKQEQG